MRFYPSSMRTGLISAAAALTIAGAGVALAANVHLRNNVRPNPTFNDGGLVLSTTVALAGLGEQTVVANLTATANVESTCTNQGGNEAPGQNPAPTTVAATPLVISPDQIKNGNLTVSLTTTSPTTPIPGAPGCPNENWTESIDDLLFTSAIITIQQPPGTTVLTVSCTFSPPTTDGPVPAGNVTCTQM